MSRNPSLFSRLFDFPQPFLKSFTPVWLGTFVVLIVIDLASKLLVTGALNFHLAPHQIMNHTPSLASRSLLDGKDRIDLIGESGSWLKLRLVFNDRFVFGSGPSAPVMGFFLTLAAVVFLALYRLHNPGLGHAWAWLLVFAGAFGNLIDKMFVKSLLDRSWHFSIFPQADHVSGVVDFLEFIWFGWDRAGTLCIPLPSSKVCPLGFLSWDTWPTFNFADSLIVVGIVLLVLTMSERREDVSG
ncbi:MAG: signal peptidase II [Spirochaetia bacterium]|nr:signal peptidase II [Spirochaetia bacterium]